MRKVALTVLLLGIAVSAQNTQPAQSSSTSSTTTQQSEPAKNAQALMNEGVAEFRKGNCPRALELLRQVLALEPNNVYAHNFAANCSLGLADYPAAVESFKQALRIQPDEYHNLSGLARAYTFAGMIPERDAVVERIRALVRDGRMPDDFSYVFDSLEMGETKVLVSHFPKLTGRFGYRYVFDFLNKAGQQTYRVSLESNDADQPLWAKDHAAAAAAGQRMFSMDGYGPNTHSTYRFYDGEPSYEQIREEVKKILAGQAAAVSKTTFQTAPAKATETAKPDNAGSSGK